MTSVNKASDARFNKRFVKMADINFHDREVLLGKQLEY